MESRQRADAAQHVYEWKYDDDDDEDSKNIFRPNRL